MPRPNYKLHNWCNMCEIPIKKGKLNCTQCGFRVRTGSRGKKKEAQLKRIE